MPTTNFYIKPQDGWVEVASSPDFVRTSGVPHSHAYFLYAGANAPSLLPGGADGSVIFGAGGPVADDTVTIGSEVYTFVLDAVDPFEVELDLTFGTGQVLITGLPIADETVTIGAETYTFKALAAAPFEVTIGADATETGDNFETAVTADSTLVTASATTGTVTLTAILGGTVGNYALSELATNVAVSGANMTGGGVDHLGTATNFEAEVNTSSTIVTASDAAGTVTVSAIALGAQGNYALSEDAANTTVSGAALTGGADVEQGISVCHHPFEVNVTMTEKLFARIVNPVPNSSLRDGSIRLDVFTIV